MGPLAWGGRGSVRHLSAAPFHGAAGVDTQVTARGLSCRGPGTRGLLPGRLWGPRRWCLAQGSADGRGGVGTQGGGGSEIRGESRAGRAPRLSRSPSCGSRVPCRPLSTAHDLPRPAADPEQGPRSVCCHLLTPGANGSQQGGPSPDFHRGGGQPPFTCLLTFRPPARDGPLSPSEPEPL